MESLRSSVSPLVPLAVLAYQNRGYLASVLAALYLANKIRKVANPKHDIKEFKQHDPTIFPQYFVNKSGLWIYTRSWTVPKPRGVIFICHGFGEHVNRYEHVARFFNSLNYNVYGMDHQGHGLSDGDRAYIERFVHYVEDFIQFVHTIQINLQKETKKALPCFLLGHSMGGCIAIQVMRATYRESSGEDEDTEVVKMDSLTSSSLSSSSHHSSSSSSSSSPFPSTSSTSLSSSSSSPGSNNSPRYPSLWKWHGCVLSSPLIIPDPHQATPLMKAAANFFSDWLPKLGVGKLDISTLSRIPAVRQQYESDPLVFHGKMKARWGNEILLTTSDIEANLHKCNFPFLVVHGTGDSIVQKTGSEQLAKLASSSDKQIVLYDKAQHEMFNDLNKELVMEEVGTWIEARTPTL